MIVCRALLLRRVVLNRPNKELLDVVKAFRMLICIQEGSLNAQASVRERLKCWYRVLEARRRAPLVVIRRC